MAQHSSEQLSIALGPSPIAHTTEPSTFPVTGHRITHGPLADLFAWRLVVSLDPAHLSPVQHHQRDRRLPPRSSSLPTSKAVITNFILDTTPTSSVPLSTLRALSYAGTTLPGTPVSLVVQGVPARFVVARPGQAGTLGADWLGSVRAGVYFDWSLYAPIIHRTFFVVVRGGLVHILLVR
jgi:hypothetical protein